jgi:demethylmenaquinone methyltransferase/2-methoxy-6-polyprenyl-1,4-benzoquinol methylase
MIRVCRPGGTVALLEFSQSRGPLRWAYNLYFKRLLPWIGRTVSGRNTDAYNYLPQSVREFPSGEAMAERMRAAGLIDVQFRPLTFGIATIYTGTRPAAAASPQTSAARSSVTT